MVSRTLTYKEENPSISKHTIFIRNFFSSSDINVATFNKSSQVPGTLYFHNLETILIFGGLNPQQELSQGNDGRAVFRYYFLISFRMKLCVKLCYAANDCLV